MGRGRLFAGTSGFAYREWKPDFYPKDLKSAEMLGFYAARLPSVEINATFYRTPTVKLLDGWGAQTPEGFRFSLKAPRRITQVQKLENAGDTVAFFLDAARSLGSRLGCILFQCPPSLSFTPERLDAFLDVLPERGFRFAMEFRHESWRDGRVRARLSERGVALCAVEGEDETDAIERTAPGFVYLRLRKPRYAPAAIRTWARRLRKILDDGADAYVYFKHEDDPGGVRSAERLIELAG